MPLSLPANAIVEDPDQPRKQFDVVALEALAADIKARGILQPIIVRPALDGLHKILFGARRFRAGLQVGLKEFPVFVAVDTRQFDSYAQVAENRQREGLSPLEEAGFIKGRLAAGEKGKDIAKKMGVSATVVTMLCALIEAPDFLLELHESGRCRSADYLYRLRKLYEQKPELVTAKVAATGEISKRFLEELTQTVNGTVVKTAGQGEGGNKKVNNDAEDDAIKYNLICLKHQKRPGQLVLTKRASAVGLGWICYDDDKTVAEVLLSDCLIDSLRERGFFTAEVPVAVSDCCCVWCNRCRSPV